MLLDNFYKSETRLTWSWWLNWALERVSWHFTRKISQNTQRLSRLPFYQLILPDRVTIGDAWDPGFVFLAGLNSEGDRWWPLHETANIKWWAWRARSMIDLRRVNLERGRWYSQWNRLSLFREPESISWWYCYCGWAWGANGSRSWAIPSANYSNSHSWLCFHPRSS